MVDEGRLTRLLRSIAERTDRLASVAASVPATPGDLWLDGVKYLFITAIEGCVDVAHHIASAARFGAPDTNADAIRALGRHDVINPDLAERMARAVGFRNVLVHCYVDVDDQVVLDALGELGDLRAFVAEVSNWLLAQ